MGKLAVLRLAGAVAVGLVSSTAAAEETGEDGDESARSTSSLDADRSLDSGASVEWFPSRVKALPCRPTIACTADIVPEGAFEVESGYAFFSSRGGEGLHATPFLAKLTVLPWLQIQAGSNGEMVVTGRNTSRHFDDVSAGLKVKFIEQTEWVPSVAVSTHLFVPTAKAVDYERDYDASSWLYISKDIGPIHADLNFAGTVHALDQKPVLQDIVALAVSSDLPLHLTPMAELYRFGQAGDQAGRDAGFLFALAWAPRPWVMFDIGGDVALYQEGRTFTAQGGMTIVPVDFWEGGAERKARITAARAAASAAPSKFAR